MRNLIVLLSLFAIAGCTHKPQPTPQRTPATTRPAGLTAAGPDGKQYPVICRLQSYDKAITGISGPNGPMYSVHDGNGIAMVKHATLEEMRVQHPEFYGLIRSAYAGVHADNIDGRSDRAFRAQEEPRTFTPPQIGQPVDRFYDASRGPRE